MIFRVSASYLFTEHGDVEERSIEILYECETELSAIVAGIRWAMDRSMANAWNQAACIKVDHYWIGKPDPSGAIRSGALGLGVFEWKYDTSPFTIEGVLQHFSKKKEIPHVG